MMKLQIMDGIFAIGSEKDFNETALAVFRHQYAKNSVYREFVDLLGIDPLKVGQPEEIPFIPISFFKTKKIVTGTKEPQAVFLSSGTTGMERSRHYVSDLGIYEESLLRCFSRFYGEPSGYMILALVPDPGINPESSLSYMVNKLMEAAHPGEKYFFLNDFSSLFKKIRESKDQEKKVMLIGLTSSLLEFSEQYKPGFPDLIVMETGGMKGKRKEIIREDLHALLCENFKVQRIHSEYGMSELLSQAYSSGGGCFSTPPWVKILIRDPHDPLSFVNTGTTGGISIIDLANFHSCSFLATQDLGRMRYDGTFEVLGRFDNSELRGCNLMA
jgi:hypothetical protein